MQLDPLPFVMDQSQLKELIRDLQSLQIEGTLLETYDIDMASCHVASSTMTIEAFDKVTCTGGIASAKSFSTISMAGSKKKEDAPKIGKLFNSQASEVHEVERGTRSRKNYHEVATLEEKLSSKLYMASLLPQIPRGQILWVTCNFYEKCKYKPECTSIFFYQ